MQQPNRSPLARSGPSTRRYVPSAPLGHVPHQHLYVCHAVANQLEGFLRNNGQEMDCTWWIDTAQCWMYIYLYIYWNICQYLFCVYHIYRYIWPYFTKPETQKKTWASYFEGSNFLNSPFRVRSNEAISVRISKCIYKSIHMLTHHIIIIICIYIIYTNQTQSSKYVDGDRHSPIWWFKGQFAVCFDPAPNT